MICGLCGQNPHNSGAPREAYGKNAKLLAIENVMLGSCPHRAEGRLTAIAEHEIERLQVPRSASADAYRVAVVAFA